MLQEQGVGKGDRVLIYMPMVPEAVFAMLACARLGAIHSVVFGGFASVNLAHRIDDAQPKVIVCADAGSRGGKVTPYKPLMDKALELCERPPEVVIVLNRGLFEFEPVAGRDLDYATLRARHDGVEVPVAWVESSTPSYVLYTSGTTGKPKGVQRDTGGYAVALASSMKHIFNGKPGDTFLCTSDIGWVVGHSYIVYGPLIGGQATILFEGTPIRPDGGILWSLVEKYKANTMFSAPTAVRVLKKQDPALLKKYDLSSLRALYMAGEPLDEPTAQWISEGLGKPIIDNYWQTETGWPILAAQPGSRFWPGRLPRLSHSLPRGWCRLGPAPAPQPADPRLVYGHQPLPDQFFGGEIPALLAACHAAPLWKRLEHGGPVFNPQPGMAVDSCKTSIRFKSRRYPGGTVGHGH